MPNQRQKTWNVQSYSSNSILIVPSQKRLSLTRTVMNHLTLSTELSYEMQFKFTLVKFKFRWCRLVLWLWHLLSFREDSGSILSRGQNLNLGIEKIQLIFVTLHDLKFAENENNAVIH